jgi:hypothetical protein
MLARKSLVPEDTNGLDPCSKKMAANALTKLTG